MKSNETRVSDIRARINKIFLITDGQPYVDFTTELLKAVYKKEIIPSSKKYDSFNVYKFLEINPTHINLAEEILIQIENKCGIFKIINRSDELVKPHNHKSIVEKYDDDKLIEWLCFKYEELSEILNMPKEKSQEVILKSLLKFYKRKECLSNNNEKEIVETLKKIKDINLLLSNEDLRTTLIYIVIVITIGCVLY
ncbi:MAG: hypothetical protein WCS56_02005 [Bacilli bacterium]